MSKKQVATGAAYIYIELITAMFAGYFFWLIITKFTTPDVIGLASAVVTISTIFSTIAILGSPSGAQRFLGKYILSNNLKTANSFVQISFIVTSIGIMACSAILFFSYQWLNVYGFNFVLVIMSIILLASTSIYTLVRAIIVATLKTRSLPLVMILSTVIKIALTLILIIYFDKTIGIIVGYASLPIIASLVLGISIFRFFKARKAITFTLHNSKRNLIELMKASFASWIPAIIYSIGTNFGVLFVFGSHGASLAGVYFIAFSLVTAISAAMSALFTIAYPLLSGMQDGRKRFAWRAVKISLLLSVPLSSSLIIFPKDIMQIFGPQYVGGSLSLQILLFSILPITVTTGINTLSYAYGKYRQVLLIGLATNAPRALLYILLVPLFDSTGAAISFTIGSIAGLVFSFFIARRIGLKLFWKDIMAIYLIPLLLAFLMSLFRMNFVLAILISILISYIILLKIGIITKSDIEDTIIVVPPRIASSLSILWKSVKKAKR